MEPDPPLGGADETKERRRLDLRWARDPYVYETRATRDPVIRDPWNPTF